MLSLASVIGGGDLAEYSVFMLFLSVIVYNLNAGTLQFLAGRFEASQRKIPKGYFKQFTLSLGVGLAGAAAIFIIFPRTPSWFSPIGLRARGKSLGYKNSVALDGNPIVEESSNLAFVVSTSDPKWLERNQQFLYFRGNTVDRFDGIRWLKTTKQRWPYHTGVDLRRSRLHLPKQRKLKIFREPDSNEELFYPMILSSVSVPRRLIGGLSFDSNGNLMRGHKQSIRYSYEVRVLRPRIPRRVLDMKISEMLAQTTQLVSDERRVDKINKKDFQKMLQIPDSVRGARFFTQWADEVGTEVGEDSLELVLGKLQAEFQKNFEPTLVSEHPGASAFESFLTQEKRGHCEYFSTAAALYLRSLGIPSRVVLGYHGGTFNPFAQTLEVREKFAHAWVELYSPIAGWMRFDPTPGIAQNSQKPWYASAQFLIAATKFWFNTYVVDYNGQTQRKLALSFRRLRQAANRSVGDSSKLYWWIALGGTAFVLLLWLGIRLRNRRRVKANPLPGYYLTFLRALKSLGYERKLGESYRCFHRRLVQKGFEADVLGEVTEVLELELYSRNSVSVQRRRRLALQLNQLKVQRKSKSAA